jgi:ABC-2 type transport system permease protein
MKNDRSYNQSGQLMLSHIKETIREPGVIFWGMIFPILMSLGLGIAFTKKADNLRKVAVLKTEDSVYIDSLLTSYALGANSSSKKQLVYEMSIRNEQMGDTRFRFLPMTWDEAIVALKRGVVSIILSGNSGNIEYHFDPLNPDAQLSYIRLSEYFGEGRTVVLESTSDIRPLTLKGTRYIDFLIPGLLAMGIMMSTMWGLSYGMIEKRSKKLLRRMVATPMNKTWFLFSFMSVRMLMNFFEALLLIIFAWLVFDISIQGSIPALLMIFVAGNFGFAGLAFFISSRTAKTEIGNGLINFIVMPMMILSGIFFSYHNFPDGLIPILQKLPLTLLADGIRSIFIEGSGVRQTLAPSLLLFGGGAIFFVLGLKIFKWY